MHLRNVSRFLDSFHRSLKTSALIGIFTLHHRYKFCSRQYDHQSELELLYYRTERIVIISIGTDRNILLLVADSLLWFRGNYLR